MCSGYHGIHIFHVSHVLLPLHIFCGKNHFIHSRLVCMQYPLICFSKTKANVNSNFPPGSEEEMDLQPERQRTQGTTSNQSRLLGVILSTDPFRITKVEYIF